MSTFSLTLIAVGIFLAIYAALVLLGVGRKDGGDRKKESMGCGFTILAAIVWSIALARYLDDGAAGIRLGVALALILPVLATLGGGSRGRVFGSVVLLTIAVLVGASAVPTLIARLKPAESKVTIQAAEAGVVELSAQIRKTEEHVGRLREDRKLLKTKIKEAGFADFAALSKDAAGYALLKELAQIDRLAAAATARQAQLKSALVRVEAAVRQIKRLADAESTGVVLGENELDRILEDARRQPVATGPATVEEHVEKEQLKKLFEEEF